MHDKRGNLIDGTTKARERARPWLGARPKPSDVEESAESRSEAPKNMAASLLVPADMVAGASTAATADDSNGNPGEVLSTEDARRRGDRAGGHDNLFLAPDAPVAANEATRAPVTGALVPVSGCRRRSGRG